LTAKPASNPVSKRTMMATMITGIDWANQSIIAVT
jgi:hypothetical protein